MFVSLKGRTCNIGQRVKVYKNLHNAKWSIMDAKSGLVLGYCDNITISNSVFKVGLKTRERIVMEKKRTVHAFIVGEIVNFEFDDTIISDTITYNPYKEAHFTTHESGRTEILTVANIVTMRSDDNNIKYN